jgi:predicted MFS family arabinose efflux permease
LLSPLVNWGLGHASGALASWQYMYLFAGCLTVLWSFCILFFLPPDPIRAHGFTERERFIIVSRMQSNNSGVRNTHFKWNQAIELLVDTKFWTLFVITILTNNTNGLASTYLPIVIAGLGFSPFVSILLLIPIGFSTGAGQLFSTFLASRFPSRRTLLMAVFQLQVMLAALLAWLLPRPSSGGRLFAMFIVWGFSASYAISMGVSIANTAGYTKRSLSSAGLFIAYCLGKRKVQACCFLSFCSPDTQAPRL